MPASRIHKGNSIVIELLRKIRWVDKYHTFNKVIPGVQHTVQEEQDIITNILEDCCTELIRLHNSPKKASVITVRNTILKYMDTISYADVSIENKDFGYELCWYIAEKANITIRKYTDTKIYGYWKITDDNSLKEVKKRAARK